MESTKAYGENGLELLEQLTLDDNDEIRERALDILDKHLDYDTDFLYNDDLITSESQTNVISSSSISQGGTPKKDAGLG